jgi:putative ABC transport system ATP-binding protein
VNGADVAKLNDNQLADLRLQIGFVFQFFNLIPRLTAIDNVELAMSIANKNKIQRRKHAIELLETVGLKDRIHHKPTELSGGQQQRVAIARALANDPCFMLLDEPTGNVDSKTAAEVLALISKLNVERGVSIIMVTHDEVLARKARRTVKMIDGQIVSDVVNTQ